MPRQSGDVVVKAWLSRVIDRGRRKAAGWETSPVGFFLAGCYRASLLCHSIWTLKQLYQVAGKTLHRPNWIGTPFRPVVFRRCQAELAFALCMVATSGLTVLMKIPDRRFETILMRQDQ